MSNVIVVGNLVLIINIMYPSFLNEAGGRWEMGYGMGSWEMGDGTWGMGVGDGDRWEMGMGDGKWMWVVGYK